MRTENQTQNYLQKHGRVLVVQIMQHKLTDTCKQFITHIAVSDVESYAVRFPLAPSLSSQWAMSLAVHNMGVIHGDVSHSMAMYLYASRISAAFRCFPLSLNAPPSPTFSDDIPLGDVTEQPSTSSGRGRCHRHCCHRNHHRHKHKVRILWWRYFSLLPFSFSLFYL